MSKDDARVYWAPGAREWLEQAVKRREMQRMPVPQTAPTQSTKTTEARCDGLQWGGRDVSVTKIVEVGDTYLVVAPSRITRVACLRCGYEQPWAGGCECDAMAHVALAGSVYAAVDERSFEFRQKCRAFRP